MKLDILRDGLQGLVNAANSAVARRSTLPVLQYLKIVVSQAAGVTVMGTNLEVLLRARSFQAQVLDDGAALVPAASFSEFLNALPSQLVRLELVKAGLRVECAQAQATFRTLAADEFPDARAWPQTPPLTVNGEELREAVKRCAPAAAGDQSRPVLTGIHLVRRGDELCFEAADGFRMAMCSLPLVNASEFEAVVSAKGLSDASRWWGAGAVHLYAEDHKALFIADEHDDVRVEMTQLDGTFPDVSPYLSVPQGSGSCVVEVADLLGALHAARVLQDEAGMSVYLEWVAGHIVMTAQNSERGDARVTFDATPMEMPPVGSVRMATRYLTQALHGLAGQVRLSWGAVGRQVMVRGMDGVPQTVHVIMPLVEGRG